MKLGEIEIRDKKRSSKQKWIAKLTWEEMLKELKKKLRSKHYE